MTKDNRKYIVSFSNRIKYKLSADDCVETLRDLCETSDRADLREFYGAPKQLAVELLENLPVKRRVNAAVNLSAAVIGLFLIYLFTATDSAFLRGLVAIVAFIGIYFAYSRDAYLKGIVYIEKKELVRLLILQLMILLTVSAFSFFANAYLLNLILIHGNLNGKLGIIIDGTFLVYLALLAVLLLISAWFYSKTELWYSGMIMQVISAAVTAICWYLEWRAVDTMFMFPNYNIYPWIISFILSGIWYTLFIKREEKEQ